MKKTSFFYKIFALTGLFALLSACAKAPATVDPALIATSAVQTVEARYTLLANQPDTATPVIVANLSTPTATVFSLPIVTPATSTPQPLDSNGKACYAAVFLEDVTIPDGMLVAPGSTFTKKWRVENIGNCTWDKTYSLALNSGDAMGPNVNVPLTESIGPGESAILAVDLTAPSTNGEYTGYWRIATPFGGTFGVGLHDQSLIVKINVTDKPKRDEGVAGIDIGLYQRVPETGCNGSKGAAYTFSATITANSAVNVTYHWVRYPDDGSRPEGGRLKFTEAGSKTVMFTWTFQPEAVQDIDRSVSLAIDGSDPQESQRIHFTFTCQE